MRKCRGFTLVELMIGILVGLLVMLAVTQSVAFVNQQRKATAGGNDAQENAQAALAYLDGELRNAGNGMYGRDSAVACQKYNAYFQGSSGTTIVDGASDVSGLPGVSMPENGMAVRIGSGSGNAPDGLTFYRALVNVTDPIGDGSRVLLENPMPTPSSVFDVQQTGDYAVGDILLIKDTNNPSLPCTIFIVTGVQNTGTDKILHNSGISGPYNPSQPTNVFTTAPAYGTGALIVRVNTSAKPTLSISSYSVVSNQLSVCSKELSSCVAADQSPLVGDIVQLQAQYGVSASVSSKVVTQWVEPTGSWANPSSANAKRIRAVRLVVVARSTEAAPGNVTAACTNAAGVANTGPCSFQDADAPVIDLSAVSVPAGRTWQNYRYRVYTTVVPLRNVVWNI